MKQYTTLLLLSLVLSLKGVSQQCEVLNVPLTGNTVKTVYGCITLGAGFSSNGYTFSATVAGSPGDMPYSAPVPGDYNYVMESAPQTAMQAIAPSKVKDMLHTISYFDGLGRPSQTVSHRGSPEGMDVVQPFYYDGNGRESRKYLPYTLKSLTEGSQASGTYRSNWVSEQSNFYNTEMGYTFNYDYLYAFSTTVFENSPLNRVTEQGSPGTVWQPSNTTVAMDGATIKYAYGTNASGEVRLMIPIEVSSAVSSIKIGTGSEHTYYNEGQLFKTRTTDENGNYTYEYKDKQGRVVMKYATPDGANNACTYYLYDNFGLLRVVIPPKAVEYINTLSSTTQTITISSTAIYELCYVYNYDARQRMVYKKLPGAEPVYMVYDGRDRVVATQDGNMRLEPDGTAKPAPEWLIIRYDAFNRPVMTALVTDTLSHAGMAALAGTFTGTGLYEEEGTALLGYTNRSFPGSTLAEGDVLTVNYYDGYVFAGNDYGEAYYNANLKDDTYFANNRAYFSANGLPTIARIKVIGTNDWETTINYLDKKGRTLASLTLDTYFNGKDITDTEYDFIGNPVKSRHKQVVNLGSGDITTTEWSFYGYDHAGRLLTTSSKIGATPDNPVVMSSNKYNEAGGLAVKNLHRTTSGYLQSVDYKYNIRGWLKAINDPANMGADKFAMNLLYEKVYGFTDGTVEAQYNGNINAMDWNNGSGRVGYVYKYDKMNRMRSALYVGNDGSDWSLQTGKYSVVVTYDLNGNIKTLQRFGSTMSSGPIDELRYDYYNNNYSNRLGSVTDNAYYLSAEGFVDGNSGTDYYYDNNGNMYKDLNKGITNISYSYLNLPVSVTHNSGTSEYKYNAAGVKLEHFDGVSTTTKYFNNFVYENGSLIYILGPEGRVLPNGSGYKYEYHLKDHLGNTRVVFSDDDGNGSISSGEVSQIADYYPFGMRMEPKAKEDAAQKYLYNGKEMQEETGWYDFEARYYMPDLGRTTTVDPHAENYYDLSPYSMFANNPLIFTDPTGMDIKFDKDASFWFKVKTTITLAAGWIASPTMRTQLNTLVGSDNTHTIHEIEGAGSKVISAERDEHNKLKPEPPQTNYVFTKDGAKDATDYEASNAKMDKWQSEHNKLTADRDGKGTSSNIYIGSGKDLRKSLKEEGYNTKVLYGHELTHAVDIDKGKHNTDNMKPGIGSNAQQRFGIYREHKAVRYQNSVARDLNRFRPFKKLNQYRMEY